MILEFLTYRVLITYCICFYSPGELLRSVYTYNPVTKIGFHQGLSLVISTSGRCKALRGYIFQKLLLAWIFSCINKNYFFIKETDIFGHIVEWTIYASQIDHFTPQHTDFEQSAACLSVFLELLPGLIPFAILWHAGWWTLEKTICMNMNYNYLTTLFRSILTQIYVILVLFKKFHFDLEKFKSKNCKFIFLYQKFVHLGKKYFQIL